MSKKPKWHLATIFGAAIALAAAPAAFAQIDSSRHFVTATVGGQFFDIDNQLDDFGRAFNDNVSVGGRYQYNFNPNWGIEGNFLFSPGDTALTSSARDLSDAPFPEEVDDFDLQQVDIDAYYYTGSVVYSFLDNGRWTPYVVGGGGLVTLDVRGGAGTETRPLGAFGGGVVYAVRDRLGIRVDVRDYIYQATDFEASSLNRLGLPSGFDQTVNDLSVTFGATILF